MDRRLTMPVWVPFLIAACVFLLDRLTKLAIEARVSMWETIVLIPGVLNIVYTRNRGAAFGIFANAPDGWREFFLIGVSVAVMGMIVWMIVHSRGAAARTLTALGLVLGGAAGNLYDRAVSGSVTDFIQVFLGAYEWPSFNVADSAITAGAVLLGWDILRTRQGKTRETA
jgi:signal peptidase II